MAAAGMQQQQQQEAEAGADWLTLLDAAFSGACVGPAVVGYWRGTWALSGLYIAPQRPALSCLIGVLLGFCGLFGFSLGQGRLGRALRPSMGLAYFCGSRAYTYLFGFCCVNLWRGAWQALDLWAEHRAAPLAASTGLSLLGLLGLRSLRNISAPPFALGLDHWHSYFDVPTRFRVSPSARDGSFGTRWLYVLDCAFSVAVVGSLVVFVWRGAWTLLDLYLFPESRERSALGSLAIGYALVALAFCGQPWARRGCARLQGLARLLLADAFVLLSFAGTVNVWRGIWNALDLYLLPAAPEASCWISHLGCFALLVALNCSNSVLVRGVYIDAEEPGGECVAFPCHYLRLILQERRRRRRAADQQASGQPTAAETKEAPENGAPLLDKPRRLESLV